MIAIKNVLCPVDFSEFSRHALALAHVVARWYDATLTVLHAYPADMPQAVSGYPDLVSPGPLFVSCETREEMVAELTRFTDSGGIRDVRLRMEARDGGAVRTILEEANALPADLVVMGTHGHGGLDRLILGSVTEKVLRKASCPVLTVPPPVSEPTATAPVLFERILCAVDFSDASMKAVTYALSLVREANAKLFLLHVLEGLPAEEVTAYPDVDLSRLIQYMETDALARLRSAIPDEARTWCNPVELLGTGKAYREIVDVAGQHDVHLIVWVCMVAIL